MTMDHVHENYHGLLEHILEEGEYKEDRTGTGTTSVFGYMMRFDLSKGFPMINTKRVPFSLIKSELLWFIAGDSNIRYLLQNKNHIWDEWAFKKWVESDEYNGPDMTDFGRRATYDPEFRKVYEEVKAEFCQRILEDDEFAKKYGDLGPVYGRQWRSWKYYNPETETVETIDQLANVMEEIKKNPYSRRLIVSAWNPGEVRKMALPPCHSLFQFYVKNGKLSCLLYQRSCDLFLGCPFNIASYALLTHMVAQVAGFEVGEFIHVIGDAHIYSNHMEQVNEQLSREPLPLPTLKLNPEIKSIFDFKMEDIELIGYESHKAIKADVAV